MQSTSSEPSTDTTIIRTGSDGRLRYTIAQRGERLGAFDRSGMSTMAFSRQHGISYQTFIAWLRKRRQSGEALPPGLPAFAEVMLQQPPPPASSAALRSFLRYVVAMREPDLLAQTQQVLAIPFKRHTRPLLGFLTLTEIHNILRSTSGSRAGRGDHALFLFLYNTGAGCRRRSTQGSKTFNPGSSRILPLAMALLQCVASAEEMALPLDGEWRFQLDSENVGIAENWHARKLDDTVQLPGTTDTNQKGTKTDYQPTDRLARKWIWIGPAWYQRENVIEFTYTPGDEIPLWDEFSPALMRLDLELDATAGGMSFSDDKSVHFGMREFKRDGSRLLINGRPVYLRGRLDCANYPLTGYAPMTLDEWRRIFRITLDWGINHYRFHSWCPPAAAFEAADELGIYIQAELPNKRSAFNAPDDKNAAIHNIDFLELDTVETEVSLYDYSMREGALIFRHFGNSPSLVMFTLGNELGRNQGMFDLVARFQKMEPRALHAQGSNNMHWQPSLAEGDDFWCTAKVGPEMLIRGAFSQADSRNPHIEHHPPSTATDYRRHIKAPEKLTLTLAIDGTLYRNRYPVWVYPPEVDTAVPDGVLLATSFHAGETRSHLAAGGRVLLIPPHDKLPHSVQGGFQTDYWSPMFAESAKKSGQALPPGTLGFLCNPAHPALAKFPTDFHSDWQWWHLVKNSRPIIFDGTPADFRPLVQMIDNFGRNHKLGLIAETKVGKGFMLICAIDLPKHQDKPEARQLMRSLLQYAGSADFAPKHALEPGLLEKLLPE